MSKLNKSLQLYKILNKVSIVKSNFWLILKFRVLDSFYYNLLKNSECNFVFFLKKQNLIKLKLHNKIYLNSFLIGFSKIEEICFFLTKYLINFDLNLKLYYGVLYTKDCSYNLNFFQKKIELNSICINKNKSILLFKLCELRLLYIKNFLVRLLYFYNFFFVLSNLKCCLLNLIQLNKKK